MATYQRKSTHTIEATQFTPALGDIIRRHALGELPETPDGTPEYLVWSEQGGYRQDGHPISFGDYIVNGSRVPRDIFEREWEPVRVAEALIARPTEAFLSGVPGEPTPLTTVSAAEVSAKAAAAPRTRRTRTEDAQ